MPAGFPNVEMAHRYSVNSPANGSIYLDNLFFRALPSPGSTNWAELIPFHATWRYATNTPPANWFATNFDDSTWLSGLAKFGAGTGPTNLTTILPQRKAAYYFRRNFVLPSQPCEELLLSAICTDAGMPPGIYLNGVKLPTSGIEVASNPGNKTEYYDLTPFLELLRPGTNTIAVKLNNTWAVDWDDIAFDLNLKTIAGAAPVEPHLEIVTQANQSQTFSTTASTAASPISLNFFGPTNSVWRVESTDVLPPVWQLMDVITIGSSSSLLLQDTGQNGRLLPSQTPSRFYRVVPN
jgi:hypothetical protein